MASKYSVFDYDSDEEREKHPDGLPHLNMYAAAMYVQSLFSASDVNCAIMGGFAFMCCGSDRRTIDIDIVVDTTAKRLWEVFEPQPRLIIPDTKLLEGVIRIFVKTGPDHGDSFCEVATDVEVDILLNGTRSSPRDLTAHRRIAIVPVAGQDRSLYLLDYLYLMRTKLFASTDRSMQRDIDDIIFLLDRYPREIEAIRDQLDPNEIEDFFSLESVRGLSPDVQTRYQVLLGR